MNTDANQNRQCRSMPRAALCALMLLTILASPALAQSQGGGKGPEDWKYTFAPYFMLPWMNGTTALRGNEIKVDAGPGDIFSNLQFGVM